MIHLDPYSSASRPAIAGERGAVAAAHPLAVSAGQEMLLGGGNAVDALIAAQAVLAVLAPDACGLGGDAFVLVKDKDGVIAVNGAGAAPAGADAMSTDGAGSVTVPGLVDSWALLAPKGALGLERCLQPSIRLARDGVRVNGGLIAARNAQAHRLKAGGAGNWRLMACSEGSRFVQPELAATLASIGAVGRAGFYEGRIGEAIVAAISAGGGAMDLPDLARPAARTAAPISCAFAGTTVHVQPPASQGVLLAMVLHAWEKGGFGRFEGIYDHIGVELTKASFASRDDVALGAELLERNLEIDLDRAGSSTGPRAYLHTAGVAAADAGGMVASSLVSVFDDFGSGVFVPEGGFVLNNRGGGFTAAGNAFAPGKTPIHTLAPILVETGQGSVALSTPGADGQVQSLAQVLISWLAAGRDLAEAVSAPRWRGEDGRLLIEEGHPSRPVLAERGHDLVDLRSGDIRFGALTIAGTHDATPFALADWRRTNWAGVS
ncbi:MAG: gamma-glutamyltransferase [Rhizobiaceae bacterium]